MCVFLEITITFFLVVRFCKKVMRKRILLLFLTVAAVSCNQRQNKAPAGIFAPKVTEAKGYSVSKDSISEPVTVPAGIPKMVKAGNPTINLTNLNVHIAGQPEITVVGLPKINTPGTDTFLLPKTIITKGIIKRAGIPEVLIAKDAAAKDINPANFSFYKTPQGLKQNTVRCMLQDKTGNLWLGTNGGGVCRYDGKSFTNFTEKEGLSNNSIYSILEDKTGNLWFATYGGVCCYDGKSFTNYTEKEGLINNHVYCIVEDKIGNLWFGTNGGVCRYDGNRVEAIERGVKIPQGAQQDLKKINGKLAKSFTNYTEKEGLSTNFVYSILEDKIGNLWFGTNGGGVCRYDGNRVEAIERGEKTPPGAQQDLKKINGKLVKSFTNYSEKEGLSNYVVLSILEDKMGNLWFGTYGGGVCRYDGNRVEAIERGEKIPSGAQQDLKKINGKFVKSFTSYTKKEGLSDNVVWSILEDKSGNLWFGTGSGGVCRYDGNRVDAIERGEKTPPGAQQDLKKINGKLIKSFTNYTEKEGLSNNHVLSILEDKSGTLWLGSDGGGLCRYDGKSFTNYTEKEGLSNNNVLSILEDKSGNLWFGTAGGGVCRYDGKSFTIFTEKDGLSSNVVLSILEDKIGNLWFGTYGGGVCRYDGKSFTNYTEKEGLISSYIYIILEDKTGNLWFGGNGGVCRYDGNRVEAIERGEKIPQGAQQDLKKINGKFVKSFTNYTKKEGLSDTDIYSILEDKIGNLWFGTGSGGVCRYDGNRVDAIERGEKTPPGAQQDLKKINGKLIKSFTNYTEKVGLSNNCVWSILEDKIGNLWFGTNGGGVCRYDGNRVEAIERGEKTPPGAQQDLKKINGKLVKSFTNFTEKEGLNNNSVLNMMQDVDGNIWFGTRNGLSKVTAKNLANFGLTPALSKKGEGEIGFNPIKEAFFYNYGYNDGFLGINSRRNSVLQDSKGRIWWGTNILTCYDPKGSITDTTAPIVNLTSVKLFGEEIAWANLNAVYPDSTGKEIIRGTTNDTLLSNGILLKDIQFDGLTKWYNLPVHLSLPYNNNNITFNFIGVHMQSRNYVKYQYKLEDIDPDWSSITDRTEAPYGNLPSGDYIFKIKAMNQSGVWSESFEYKFVVRPPWWRTWWFRTLVGLLTIGSIFYFIKSREKKLVAEKEKLEKTVDERTAEVIAQKHIVEEKHKEITDSINYAERIQRALLASKKMLDENLSNYFILFKPKDVVSGDFYWAAKLSNKQFVLVTADSTGHGVPGAIMSIVNIASLKAASLQGITSPDLLLNETRRLVIENLKNDGSAEGGKDGMDGSLLSFDFKNNILYCASANNPVWIIRSKELIEIKADRMPIGKHDKDQFPFTLQTQNLQKGDLIYTLTDGFADQFGGVSGKKFMYKQLQNFLLAIANEPLETQKQKLNDVFDNWKGNLEQVDDVCLIGIRV